MNLGFPEIVVIVIVIMLVFGPKKVPELGRAVGRGMKEFRNAMHDFEQSLDYEEKKPLDSVPTTIIVEEGATAPEGTPPEQVTPQAAEAPEEPDEGTHGPDRVV